MTNIQSSSALIFFLPTQRKKKKRKNGIRARAVVKKTHQYCLKMHYDIS